MKKLLFLTALGVFLYLNRSYAHIYSTIKGAHLTLPVTEVSHPVGDRNIKPLVYYALGDSLTAGAGVASAGQTLPHQLAVRIASGQGVSLLVTNLAVPGATAADVLGTQVPQALAAHPDLVTILIGVNDIHNRTPIAEFRKNIRSIATAFDGTRTVVAIGTIPFIGSDSLFLPPYNLYFAWQTERYSNALLDALSGTSVHLVPLETLTSSPDWRTFHYYSTDSFHPNKDGYRSWSMLFYDSLYRR